MDFFNIQAWISSVNDRFAPSALLYLRDLVDTDFSVRLSYKLV